MSRPLLTAVFALFCAVSVVAFSPVSSFAAPGDYCWAAGQVPGHRNSSELCVPDDMPIGQSCGPGYHADSSGNCVQDASFGGQSCESGFHTDSSGNCVKDASFGGQSCGSGYHADSSGNCVQDASFSGQSCATGYHADSSGTCIKDASFSGQSCVASGGKAGTLDSSGNCVATETAGTAPATTGTGGVKQNPAAGSSIKSGGSTSNGIDVAHLKRYSDSIIGVINSIVVPVLFAVAFLLFLYGVMKFFILNSDSDTEREKGRHFVLWAVIAFAVILSVWGLVNLVLNTFMLSPGGAPPKYPLL